MKSQSFRGSPSPAPHREGSSPPLGFPSLPAQPLRPDVILKKNKSMSSALSVEASHQRFRSSIEVTKLCNNVSLSKTIYYSLRTGVSLMRVLRSPLAAWQSAAIPPHNPMRA